MPRKPNYDRQIFDKIRDCPVCGAGRVVADDYVVTDWHGEGPRQQCPECKKEIRILKVRGPKTPLAKVREYNRKTKEMDRLYNKKLGD